MKRIFLTSGLVLCMACPAMADFTSSQGSTTQPTTLPTACTNDNLSSYGGSSTLNAQWTAHDVSITYVANAPAVGAGAAQGQTNTVEDMPNNSSGLKYDDPYTVGSAPSLYGYTFNGWNASVDLSDGEGTATYDGGEAIAHVKADPSSTLTAQWTAKTATLTYNPGTYGTGSGTGTLTFDQKYTPVSGTAAGITANNGYTFVGWASQSTDTTATACAATASNGCSTELGPHRSEDGVTLYAVYTANPYSITYDCGNGTLRDNGAMPSTNADTNHTFNTSYTFADNNNGTQCYKTGYHFTGWNCESSYNDGSMVGTHAGGSSVANWTTAGAVTCHAVFVQNTINLQWTDTEGNVTISGGGESCEYGSAIQLPTNPSRTGYDFAGWEVTSHTNDSQAYGTQP